MILTIKIPQWEVLYSSVFFLSLSLSVCTFFLGGEGWITLEMKVAAGEWNKKVNSGIGSMNPLRSQWDMHVRG